jgi:hypothetical protein
MAGTVKETVMPVREEPEEDIKALLVFSFQNNIAIF